MSASPDTFFTRSGSSPPPVFTTIPREQIPAVIALLAARLIEPEPKRDDRSDEPDPLLTADEVAERLGASRPWVYRHADALGVIRLTRKKLRFSQAEVERYLRRRRSHG